MEDKIQYFIHGTLSHSRAQFLNRCILVIKVMTSAAVADVTKEFHSFVYLGRNWIRWWSMLLLSSCRARPVLCISIYHTLDSSLYLIQLFEVSRCA